MAKAWVTFWLHKEHFQQHQAEWRVFLWRVVESRRRVGGPCLEEESQSGEGFSPPEPGIAAI